MRIGDIGNDYGSLEIMIKDGKHYWGIEDWSGTYWEEIPEELYNMLVEFENKRKK